MISSECKQRVLCKDRFLYPLGLEISIWPTSHLPCYNSIGVAYLVLKSAILLAGK